MNPFLPPIIRLPVLALSVICFVAGLSLRGFFTAGRYRRQRRTLLLAVLTAGVIGLWTAGVYRGNIWILAIDRRLINVVLLLGRTTGFWIGRYQEWITPSALATLLLLSAVLSLKVKGRAVPLLLLLFSAGASLLGGVALGRGQTVPGTFFLAGAVLYAWVYGLTGRRTGGCHPPDPLQGWRGYGMLAAIVVLGFYLRFHNLGEVSFRFDHYETDYARQAFRILDGRHNTRLWLSTGWRGLGHLNLSPVYSYCVALAFALFDASIFSLKLVPVFYGTAALLFSYGIFKLLFDRRLALLAAFLLAVSPMHINYSRIGLLLVSTQTVSLAIVYLLLRCLKGDRPYVYVLLGMALSFAAYFYSPAKYPILISAFLFAVYMVFKRRFLRRNFFKIMLLVLTIVAITIAFNIPTWGLLFPRFEPYESVWHRTREHVHTPEPDYARGIPLVEENAVRLVESFFIGRNFNYNPWPCGNLYFNPFVSVMVLTGLAFSLANFKNPSYRLLLFFTAAFLIPNLLSRPPVVVRRMMVSWPFFYCLAAIPVAELLTRSRRLFSRTGNRLVCGAVALSLAGLGAYNAHVFFDSDQPAGRWEEERYFDEYAKNLLDNYALYILPIDQLGRQTIDFILGQKTRKGEGEYRYIGPREISTFSRADLPKGRNAAFICGYPHVSRRDLENLQSRLGSGKIEEVKTRFGRIVGYALLYRPGAAPGETGREAVEQ